jgi:hypothetical protein
MVRGKFLQQDAEHTVALANLKFRKKITASGSAVGGRVMRPPLETAQEGGRISTWSKRFDYTGLKILKLLLSKWKEDKRPLWNFFIEFVTLS